MIEQPPWRGDADLRRVLDALADAGEARIVGGAVRDALAGRPVADIDVALNKPPEIAAKALERVGIKVVPTGIEHGVVTAVSGGRGIEVASLRRDVATDGRRAVVAFTENWREDAARRDFTMNAMSATFDGAVFDYFGGREDLAAGNVRFVGAPERRVREDYLRILRFFRFYAWYGSGAPDAPALAACRDGVAGLAHVSAERVRVELLRLLDAPDPAPALAAMVETGIAEAVLGAPPSDLSPLLALETAHGMPPDVLLRLAILAPGVDLAARLRLSRAEADRLGALQTAEPLEGDQHAVLYRLGAARYRDHAILAALSGDAADLPERLALADTWKAPKFPLSGADLLAASMSPGPGIGEALRHLESAWIASGFTLGREALMQTAARLIAEEGNER